MVKRLTSYLKNRTEWRLLFEVVLSAVFLFLVISPIGPIGLIRPIGLIGLIVFLIRVYFSHLPQIKNFWFSFWLLPVLVWLTAGQIGLTAPAEALAKAGLIILYAILFFILLGISNFLFKNEAAVYSFFHAVLLVFVFLIYFSLPITAITAITLITSIGLIVTLTLLFKEFFQNSPIGPIGPMGSKRLWAISLIISLLAFELSLMALFLPLGFINAAVLITLLLLLGRDVLQAHLRGDLNLTFVFRELTILIIFLIIIFVTSFSGNRSI